MKKKITFTAEEEIINEFRKTAEENSLNQSSFIEKCLLKYIGEHKEDKK